MLESAALKGGRSHPKLNIAGKPIVQKYCEGKVKRTLKRELKVLEIAKRETYGAFACMHPVPVLVKQGGTLFVCPSARNLWDTEGVVIGAVCTG